MSRSFVIIIVLIVVLAVGGGLVWWMVVNPSNGDVNTGENANVGTNGNANSEVTQTLPEGAVAIDRETLFAGHSLRLQSASIEQSFAEVMADEGMVFVVVYYDTTVTPNATSTFANIAKKDVTLVSGESAYALYSVQQVTLADGTEQGNMVFQVPEDATDVQVKFDNATDELEAQTLSLGF